MTTEISAEDRRKVVFSSHRGTDSSLRERITAHLTLPVLIFWWVGGCLSPLLLGLLAYKGYYTFVTIALIIGVTPYIRPFKPSGAFRWFISRGSSCFSYYAPFGFHTHFMAGAREALAVQSLEEYKRKRDDRRRNLSTPVKSTASASTGSSSPTPSLAAFSPAPLSDPTPSSSSRKPILLAVSPHGIFPLSMFLGCLANPDLYRVNPGITFLVSSVLHKAPYWNILEQLLGQFGSADKASMTETMRRGADIALIPGGFEEASLYQHGRHKLYLRDRAGFIKMALQHGYDIVPMYTFGEEKSYYNLPGLESLRLALNRWQIPGVVPIGKFGLMPFSDHRMDVFFASPLRLPHIASPTREDVAKWHGEYLKRIAEVFDAGKDIAGQPDAVLEVF